MLNIRYLGRKGSSGMYQFIINKMPKHDIFIDCFMGTGYISSIKKPAEKNYGIEISKNLCSKLSMFAGDFDIICGDVLVELPILLDISMSADIDICIYLDPPYLPETRSSFKTCKYDYEFSYGQHIQLLSMLEQISKQYSNVYILLSGYKSDLYMSMLANWYYFETNAMSRGGSRVESLWCNFDPDKLKKHQYDYVGHNFTDRQRIKRKSKRWIDNLKKMPVDERNYILESIKSTFFEDLS